MRRLVHLSAPLQRGYRLQTKDDLLSGLTVALALVPEAVAFAIIAGVPPLVGLYAAFIVCLVTAIAGGRPGMISGATGALAVIMVGLVKLGNAFLLLVRENQFKRQFHEAASTAVAGTRRPTCAQTVRPGQRLSHHVL